MTQNLQHEQEPGTVRSGLLRLETRVKSFDRDCMALPEAEMRAVLVTRWRSDLEDAGKRYGRVSIW